MWRVAGCRKAQHQLQLGALFLGTAMILLLGVLGTTTMMVHVIGHCVKLPWALLLNVSDLGVARVLGEVVV